MSFAALQSVMNTQVVDL